MQDGNFTAIVDAIVKVGQQRNTILNDIRCALESGNNEKALLLVRELCGLRESTSVQ